MHVENTDILKKYKSVHIVVQPFGAFFVAIQCVLYRQVKALFSKSLLKAYNEDCNFFVTEALLNNIHSHQSV